MAQIESPSGRRPPYTYRCALTGRALITGAAWMPPSWSCRRNTRGLPRRRGAARAGQGRRVVQGHGPVERDVAGQAAAVGHVAPTSWESRLRDPGCACGGSRGWRCWSHGVPVATCPASGPDPRTRARRSAAAQRVALVRLRLLIGDRLLSTPMAGPRRSLNTFGAAAIDGASAAARARRTADRTCRRVHECVHSRPVSDFGWRGSSAWD